MLGSENADGVAQNFAFAGGETDGVGLCGKLSAALFQRTAAVPWLKADVGGVFARGSPEGYHGETIKIHVNAAAGGADKAYAVGVQTLENKGVDAVLYYRQVK